MKLNELLPPFLSITQSRPLLTITKFKKKMHFLKLHFKVRGTGSTMYNYYIVHLKYSHAIS